MTRPIFLFTTVLNLTAAVYFLLILSGSVDHSLVLGGLTTLMVVFISCGFMAIDIRLSAIEKGRED